MGYSIADAVDDGQHIFDEFEAYDFWGKVSFNGGRDYEDDPLVDTSKVHGQCWAWNGANDAGDAGAYGRYAFHGVKQRAHRLAYRDFGKKLSDELVIDHLCRNTLCVNPAHLEPVTHAVNVQRGLHNLDNRTHCGNGHELAVVGVQVRGTRSGTVRRCSECLRASARRTYLRRKQAGKIKT